MASKSKGSKSKTNGTDTAPVDQVLNTITQRALKELTDTINRFKGNVDTTVGKIRNTLKQAIEDHGLHKKAFADYQSYEKMVSAGEPEKALERYLYFKEYMDKGGILKAMNVAGRLDMGDGPKVPNEVTGAAKTEKASAADDDKVVNLH